MRRFVPGAAPPSSAAAKPKKKKGGNNAAKKDETAQVTDAASAALLTKAPENPSSVASGLKVTSTDLAEEAEKQTALATVEILQDVEKNGKALSPSTPAQSVIVQQIEKLKSSSTSTPGQIHELEQLFDAVQKAEEVDPKPTETQTASTDSSVSSKAQLVLLLQFLHLFNLFHPNPANPPSFAPSQVMPPALQMSTGQQVAALGKLFDQLANGPLEGGGGDALEILANIESGSDKEVLPDVTFDTVRSMILKLTAPPAEAEEERLSPETGLDGPMKGFITAAASPAAGQPPVSFIQESELIDHTEQEPEGGQPDTVPTTGSGPTAKGEAGGAGVVPGSAASTTTADGSAAAQVAEPINTTETNTSGPTKSEAKLNWADVAEEDDDDLGEAPVFEPLSSSATPTSATPVSATPTPAWSNTKAAAPAPIVPAATAPVTQSGPSINQPKDKKPKASNGQAANGKGASRNGSTPAPDPKPVGKGQPKVDEDGFIVQESKRTRYLQQKQQQQQQNRGGGRGGSRMGAAGNRGGARQGGQQRPPARGAQDASGETQQNAQRS